MFYVTRGSGSTPAAGMLSFPPAAGSSVQHLVDAAVPSPFGKGSETVFDPAVRTAAEIKAAQLALNKALPPPEVLDEVRALLQPSATSVVAELDKLNIYGPGGFFKPHYDTPRSQDHFGTLIICLPSPFKGGQLLLRHVDHNSSAAPSTRTYDWSASADAAPQGLQWAAFYADTGVKTSSNNLKGPGTEAGQPDQKGAVSSSSSSSSSNGSWMTPADVSASAELVAEVRRLLADKDWHGSGERLGFVLQQKYSAGLADLAALTFPEALKGPDRLLAAALQQAGLQPR
uniref:Fe2OG dioxygenase domain-containing protein n=1 Tax=Tetradesmus obliquus TaxID=3088 RepID=A0A383VSD5_TETOB|eukprot:jgi/Sobl393_1/4347/SZX67682.1